MNPILVAAILALFIVPFSPPDELSSSVVVEARNVGHGSGVFVSPTQVLTAQHVADMTTEVRDVTGGLHNILKVANSPDADVSILTVDHPFRGVVPRVSCTAPERGERLHYYGNPSAVEFVGPMYLHFIGGRAQDFPPDIDLAEGVIVGGSSGSGVMNEAGDVVGLITISVIDTVGESAIPALTGMGGYVSFHYPEVCNFVRSLRPGDSLASAQ